MFITLLPFPGGSQAFATWTQNHEYVLDSFWWDNALDHEFAFWGVLAYNMDTGRKELAGPWRFVKTNESPVIFPDPNLEEVIRERIGRTDGDIYPSDLRQITVLNASLQAIFNLTGLQYCENLEWLNLERNQIGDISPLEGLTSLKTLKLSF